MSKTTNLDFLLEHMRELLAIHTSYELDLVELLPGGIRVDIRDTSEV